LRLIKQHTAFDDFYTVIMTFQNSAVIFTEQESESVRRTVYLGVERLNMLEIRYGHYTKSVGMKSDIISLNLKI
jgi:hypothetical protein